MRKSKELRKNLQTLVDEKEKAEKILQEAEENEKSQLEEVRQKIEGIAKDKNLFCGVVLTLDDIVNIVRLAAVSKESIKIPFVLYYEE